MKLFTNTNSIFATVFVMVVTCTQWVIADERLYVYPNDGQDKEQIGQDRYECHRWAVDETGFDPTEFDQPAPPDLVVVPENPNRGATGIGIITGAVIGGVLGSMDHHTGTGTGVAIGGVIGGVAGAVVDVRRVKRRNHRRPCWGSKRQSWLSDVRITSVLSPPVSRAVGIR